MTAAIPVKHFILSSALAEFLALPSTVEAKSCGRTSNGLAVIANKATSCPFAKRVGNRAMRIKAEELRPGLWGIPPTTIRVRSPVTRKRYKMRCRTVVQPDSPFTLCTGGKDARVEVRP